MATCVFCEYENSIAATECQQCGSLLPSGGNQRLDDATFRTQLLELLKRGEKLKAIGAYGRQTGASQSAASEYIDGLESDQEFAAGPNADVEWLVGKLLERGEKDNAIKVYREGTGLDSQTAEAEVDALEIRLGLTPSQRASQSGCALIFLMIGTSLLWFTVCVAICLQRSVRGDFASG